MGRETRPAWGGTLGGHVVVAGANAIIALRCCILSGRIEDFCERRAKDAA